MAKGTPEERFDLIDAAERDVATSLARLQALRQESQ